MSDNNLPIVNAIDELKASNKDQRERLQKSMRAGLLNVKKSVDALSFSFERSLIDQSLAQEKIHEATMAFHEESLEQGKHSGHLFAAKMTAVGAGLVAWFESKMFSEFQNVTKAVKEGKNIHITSDDPESKFLKDDNRLLHEINEVLGGGKNRDNIRTKLKSIEDLLSKHPGISKELKKQSEIFEEMTDEQRIIFSALEQDRNSFIVSAREEKLEEKREEKAEKIESGDAESEDAEKVKSGLGWWAKIFRGVAALGVGILAHDHWDKIKSGLISIKDFIQATYKHVSENSDIYKGIATLMGSIWLLSKAWLVSVAVIQGTTAAISGAFAKIAAAFRIIKKAFLPLTLIFGAWEAGAKAIEEYEKSGDWKKASGTFGVQFVKSIATAPFRLVETITNFILSMFGAEEVDWNISENYDNFRKIVNDTVYGVFDWIGEKIKEGWIFFTETAPEWVKEKQNELTQVFQDLYDDAIRWVRETFSWDNLKNSLGFGDESVMTDPNVKPSENLTRGLEQAIEDQKNADKLSQLFKDRLQGVTSSNTPSGNGAGETMLIKGTVDGQSITAPIVTNAPTSINNQNNTTNNSTIMQPLSTNPSAGFNWTDTNNRLFDIP